MDNSNFQNNNWQNGPQNGYYIPFQSQQKNSFAIAAMVLGLCSILSLCTFVLPLPLGALGILFVILSKRKAEKFHPLAMTGLISSLVGILVGLVCTISVFATAFSMLKPENRDTLNQQFEQIYGMDFDEYLERIYGEDYSEYFNEQFNGIE